MPSASAFRRLSALLCVLALSAPSLVTAQSFSTLEERMSVSQFRAAGLDKLSEEELAALNTWLQNHVSGAASSAPAYDATDRLGLSDITYDTQIGSKLIGDFEGWTGKTTFQLENGQVWQQTGNDRWNGPKLSSPSIIIEPAFMGSWRLKVEGYNTSTKVKRIK